eukprot:CAMPEP_0170488396 /NCGR_PEP_ID=MMETSP0208-20121228/6957_1 /TAXON_ID=197538 /ORGANISM="Strombidium inclinatum, Strain S3" /LENGTH=153 /DNA_ID=CAMNT_0010762945 /DNA_START=67 /DNA_END=525 /DNA_ORIENTATION=-
MMRLAQWMLLLEILGGIGQILHFGCLFSQECPYDTVCFLHIVKVLQCLYFWMKYSDRVKKKQPSNPFWETVNTTLVLLVYTCFLNRYRDKMEEEFRIMVPLCFCYVALDGVYLGYAAWVTLREFIRVTDYVSHAPDNWKEEARAILRDVLPPQ